MEIDRTLYISNLPPDISDVVVYELFLQAGPVESVTLKGNYGFVTFEDEESVLYSCSLFEGVRLYNYELTIKPRQGSKFEKVPVKQYPPYAFDNQPPPLPEPGYDRHRDYDRPDDRFRYPPIASTSNPYIHEPRGYSGFPVLSSNMPLLATTSNSRRSFREPPPHVYDRRYRPY
nr:nucleotide binding protein 2 (nbp 2) [Hymenolepis microstoma]